MVKHITIWYSTVEFSAILYFTVQYRMVQYSVLWYGMVHTSSFSVLYSIFIGTLDQFLETLHSPLNQAIWSFYSSSTETALPFSNLYEYKKPEILHSLTTEGSLPPCYDDVLLSTFSGVAGQCVTHCCFPFFGAQTAVQIQTSIYVGCRVHLKRQINRFSLTSTVYVKQVCCSFLQLYKRGTA